MGSEWQKELTRSPGAPGSPFSPAFPGSPYREETGWAHSCADLHSSILGQKMVNTHISAFGTGETHHTGLPTSTLRAGGAGAAILARSTLRGEGNIGVGHNSHPQPSFPHPMEHHLQLGRLCLEVPHRRGGR